MTEPKPRLTQADMFINQLQLIEDAVIASSQLRFPQDQQRIITAILKMATRLESRYREYQLEEGN